MLAYNLESDNPMLLLPKKKKNRSEKLFCYIPISFIKFVLSYQVLWWANLNFFDNECSLFGRQNIFMKLLYMEKFSIPALCRTMLGKKKKKKKKKIKAFLV